MQRANDAAFECESLIKLLHTNALALGSEELLEKDRAKFGALKSAIHSYFVLNDILLGQVIGDEEIGKEKSGLANTLNGFQQKVENGLFAELIDTLRNEEIDISIDESRTILRRR